MTDPRTEDGYDVTVRRVSNSELRLFKRCRRKWWLGHHRGLRPRQLDVSGARALGSRIHEVLAAYYAPTDPVVNAADALAVWDRGTEIALERTPEREVELRKDHDLGRAMLEGYFEWLTETGVDADWEVVGAEREVEVPFEGYVARNGRPVTLLAKLDLRVRSRQTGAQAFVDHKTVGNLTDLPKTAELHEQFLHYSLLDYLEHLAAGADPESAAYVDGGVYNMLRKVKRTARAKPPFYGRHEVRHTREELRSYWLRLVGEIGDVQTTELLLEQGTDHRIAAYPHPTRDCSWDCEFRALCPMLDDPRSDPEGFIEAAYEAGDPYERYQSLDDEGA